MFRGSDSLLDWIKNFLFLKKEIPYDGTNPKIKIHSGFLRNYKLVREMIHKVVKQYNLKKVVLFGHSMGGCASALAALDIQYNFSDIEIGCLTIGTPKLGNKYFKKSFENRVPDYINVEHASDLVIQIPPSIFGFEELKSIKHIGPDRKKGIGSFKDHNGNKYHDILIKEIDRIM